MRHRLVAILSVIAALVAATVMTNAREGDSASAVGKAEPVAQLQSPFVSVDIDRYVAEQRPLKKGTTTIMAPRRVRFHARLKQEPRKRTVKYLYTALSFHPMDPEPRVSHRMFVETPGGHILPLYVEDGLVEPMKGLLAEGDKALFQGWHVYNYSKGPAILITSFQPTAGEAGEATQ